jgi:hypothetical protein
MQFLSERVFPLLDLGDRRTLGKLLVEKLAETGHLESSDRQTIEALVGAGFAEQQPAAERERPRIQSFEFHWSDDENLAEPRLSTLLSVEMRFPARCSD